MITDMASPANNVTAIGDTVAQPVRHYTEDKTPPKLISFNLDLTTEVLYMSFDETILVSSFNEKYLTIMSVQNYTGDGSFVNLTLVDTLNTDATYLAVNISTVDLDAIKKIRDLGIGPTSTHLALTAATITDMNGNDIVPVNMRDAKRITTFKDDYVEPRVISFNISMEADGVIRVVFNEMMDLLTFKPSLVTIQGSKDGSIGHKLTGGSLPVMDDTNASTILEFTLLKDDRNIIKGLGLVTSVANSWISMTENALLDMNGNPIVTIARDNGIQTSDLVPDSTPPHLETFHLDMSKMTMELLFSEPIDKASFKPLQLTLQATSTPYPNVISLNGSNPSHTLINSTGYCTGLRSCFVDISPIDANLLRTHIDPPLAKSNESSFLQVSSMLISDPTGNQVVSAVVKGTYVTDTIIPKLVHYGMDMRAGVLTLTFDEILRLVSLDELEPIVSLSYHLESDAPINQEPEPEPEPELEPVKKLPPPTYEGGYQHLTGVN
jgi:hypothetical protein